MNSPARTDDILPKHAIVVGVDGSAESDAAVAWAADEACRRRSTLLVVHSADPSAYGLWTTTTRIRQGIRKLAQPILERSVAIALESDARPRVRGKLILGSPALALQHMSSRADLVVIGRSGKGALAGTLLGSVARRLAAASHTPVVLIGSDTDRDEIDRIVLAVSDRPTDGCAAKFAFTEATLRDVPVYAVNAWHVSALPTPGVPGPMTHPGYLLQARRNEVAGSLERWHARFPGVPLTSLVVEDTPVNALNLVVCTPRDLLVLGQHRHSRFAPHSVGPVISAELHSAVCPIAIVGEPAVEPTETASDNISIDIVPESDGIRCAPIPRECHDIPPGSKVISTPR